MLDHVIHMPTATRFLEVDQHLLPTGVISSVLSEGNTYLDFTGGQAIGRSIKQGKVTPQGGYDNAFLFYGNEGKFVSRVGVHSPISGISMDMWTDQPSVQIYTGNFLNGTIARKSTQGGPDETYQHWGAVTFEAQAYPDAVTHASFPSVLLRPGQTYTQTTSYRFLASDAEQIISDSGHALYDEHAL